MAPVTRAPPWPQGSRRNAAVKAAIAGSRYNDASSFRSAGVASIVTAWPSRGRASTRTRREKSLSSGMRNSGGERAKRETKAAACENLNRDRRQGGVKRSDMPGQRFRFRNGLRTFGPVNIPRKRRGEIVWGGVVERSRISGVAAVEGAPHRLQAFRYANIRYAHLAQRVVEMGEEGVHQILGDRVRDAAQRR